MHVTLEVNMLSEVPRIIYARADLLTTWMNYYGFVAYFLHDFLHRSIPVIFRIPYMHSNEKLKNKDLQGFHNTKQSCLQEGVLMTVMPNVTVFSYAFC